MKKPQLSFQLRLYLNILFWIILIFGSIAVVFSSFIHQQEEEQATQYSFALQNSTSQNFEDEMEWMEQTVELTVKRVMANPSEDRHKSLKFIAQLVKNNSLLLGVGYINYTDQSLHNTSLDYVYEDSISGMKYNCVPLTKYDHTKTQWYQNATRKKHGEWTEPYLDQTGIRKAIITYALPLKDSLKNITGVVTADVALTELTDELNSVQPFDHSYSFILSKKGTVVAHPKTELILKEDIFSLAKTLNDDDYTTIGKKIKAGGKGSLHCELDGTDVLVSYAPLPHFGWYVVSVCPYSAIVSELGSVSLKILLIMVVGLILLSVCLRILITHMIRPVRQMTDAAYQIAQGDFNASLPAIAVHDDFGKLHDAFEHMQQSLKTHIRDLENATQARERINGELKAAQRIQTEILPTDFVLSQGYENIDIDGFLKPARQVGGDFYDFVMKDGKIYFTIGDVSGKGVAAAIVMAMTCTLFRSLVAKHSSTSEIMDIINENLARNNQTDMFATMFLGILDTRTGEMRYCNAGHNTPYLFSVSEGCCKLPTRPKLPLALFGNTSYVEQTYQLKPGQSLLLYTDGLTEAENAGRQQFGSQRVEQLLATLGGKTSHEVITNVREQLQLFVGEAEQSDDLTLFTLCYDGCRTLILDNRQDELAKLPPFVWKLTNAFDLTHKDEMSLRLVLEEALMNIISYAYPKRDTGKVNLKAVCHRTGERTCLRLEITDSGKPFDPTQAKTNEAQFTHDIEQRPVGGLGIFLIRKHMDEVTYKRENDMNKLIMIKYIK